MKKILSVMLVIMIVFSTCISYASSFENGVSSALTSTKNEAWLVNSSGSASKTSSANVEVKDGQSYMVYRIAMPEIDANQIFDEFNFSVVTYDGRSRDLGLYLNLYKLPGDNWNPSALTLSDITKENLGTITNSVDTGTSGKNFRHTIDITDYANECRGQSYIYLAATIKTISAAVWVGSNDTYRAKYSFTPAAAPNLTLDAVSLSDGSEITTDTAVSFTYSNSIVSADITLNGASAERNISSNVVSLTTGLEQLKNYNLAITVTDIYSNTDTYSMSFATGIDKIVSSSNASKTLFITSKAPATIQRAGDSVGYNAAHAYFRVPLPTAESGAMVEKYNVTFYVYSDNLPSADPIQIYKLDGEAWDETTLSSGEPNFAKAIADYDSYGIKNCVKYAGPGSANKEYKFEIDLTAYASECLAKGQSNMCIAITSSKYLQIYGTYNWTNYGYRTPSCYCELATNPAFEVYNVSSDVSGNTLKSLSFNILTSAENASDFVELINTKTNETVEADFDYDAFTRKVYLNKAVSLLENANYRLVLVGGLSDMLGNSLSENIVVSEFATGINFGAEIPKIISSTAEISDYSSAPACDTVTKGKSYKYVTEVTNNTGENVQVIMVIAMYNSADELISLSFEPTEISFNGTELVYSENVVIEGDASYIKAFAWDKDNKPLAVFDYAKAQ